VGDPTRQGYARSGLGGHAPGAAHVFGVSSNVSRGGAFEWQQLLSAAVPSTRGVLGRDWTDWSPSSPVAPDGLPDWASGFGSVVAAAPRGSAAWVASPRAGRGPGECGSPLSPSGGGQPQRCAGEYGAALSLGLQCDCPLLANWSLAAGGLGYPPLHATATATATATAAAARAVLSDGVNAVALPVLLRRCVDPAWLCAAPCNGHGDCTEAAPSVGSELARAHAGAGAQWSCRCAPGYAGQWCQHCAAGYTDYPHCVEEACYPDPCNLVQPHTRTYPHTHLATHAPHCTARIGWWWARPSSHQSAGC
jgi:hypothetical protein